MNTTKLSNLQLELIKLFSYQLSEKQLKDIRALLASYFAQQATEEMNKLWEENNWTTETMRQWGNEHMRTKYKS